MAIITANIALGVTGFSITVALVTSRSDASLALHSIIGVFNFISFILTIIHAAFCCGGACKSNAVTAQVTSIAQPNVITTPQLQYMQGPSGQYFIASQSFPLEGTTIVQSPTYIRTYVQYI